MNENIEALEDNVRQVLDSIQRLSKHGIIESYVINQVKRAITKAMDEQICAMRSEREIKPITFRFKMREC